LWPQPQPVQLVVSAGPPVPDFVGQPQAAADGWAQANGIKLDVVTVKSDVPAGTITHQSLPAGSAFTRGQVIIVTISAGPPTVAIPNVDGLPVDRATHILEKLGFSVTINQVGPLDTVFHHSPDGQAAADCQAGLARGQASSAPTSLTGWADPATKPAPAAQPKLAVQPRAPTAQPGLAGSTLHVRPSSGRGSAWAGGSALRWRLSV